MSYIENATKGKLIIEILLCVFIMGLIGYVSFTKINSLLVDSLKESVAQQSQTIAFNDKDWKNYTTKVHALKSSALVIGANELSEKAKRLEDAGNSNYVNEIKQDTKPLLELYRSYENTLEPLIKQKENDKNKPLIEEEELKEAYETMKEVSLSFDYESIMFILESLEEYRVPKEEVEYYNLIKEAASKPDWDKLQKLLNQ